MSAATPPGDGTFNGDVEVTITSVAPEVDEVKKANICETTAELEGQADQTKEYLPATAVTIKRIRSSEFAAQGGSFRQRGSSPPHHDEAPFEGWTDVESDMMDPIMARRRLLEIGEHVESPGSKPNEHAQLAVPTSSELVGKNSGRGSAQVQLRRNPGFDQSKSRAQKSYPTPTNPQRTTGLLNATQKIHEAKERRQFAQQQERQRLVISAHTSELKRQERQKLAAMQRLFPAAEFARLKEEFCKLDKDKSGTLEAKELEAAVYSLGGANEQARLAMETFLEMDTNQDGVCSFIEFLQWAHTMKMTLSKSRGGFLNILAQRQEEVRQRRESLIAQQAAKQLEKKNKSKTAYIRKQQISQANREAKAAKLRDRGEKAAQRREQAAAHRKHVAECNAKRKEEQMQQQHARSEAVKQHVEMKKRKDIRWKSKLLANDMKEKREKRERQAEDDACSRVKAALIQEERRERRFRNATLQKRFTRGEIKLIQQAFSSSVGQNSGTVDINELASIVSQLGHSCSEQEMHTLLEEIFDSTVTSSFGSPNPASQVNQETKFSIFDVLQICDALKRGIRNITASFLSSKTQQIQRARTRRIKLEHERREKMKKRQKFTTALLAQRAQRLSASRTEETDKRISAAKEREHFWKQKQAEQKQTEDEALARKRRDLHHASVETSKQFQKRQESARAALLAKSQKRLEKAARKRAIAMKRSEERERETKLRYHGRELSVNERIAHAQLQKAITKNQLQRCREMFLRAGPNDSGCINNEGFAAICSSFGLNAQSPEVINLLHQITGCDISFEELQIGWLPFLKFMVSCHKGAAGQQNKSFLSKTNHCIRGARLRRENHNIQLEYKRELVRQQLANHDKRIQEIAARKASSVAKQRLVRQREHRHRMAHIRRVELEQADQTKRRHDYFRSDLQTEMWKTSRRLQRRQLSAQGVAVVELLDARTGKPVKAGDPTTPNSTQRASKTKQSKTKQPKPPPRSRPSTRHLSMRSPRTIAIDRAASSRPHTVLPGDRSLGSDLRKLIRNYA